MNRLFSIAVAAILASGAFWFCSSQCVAQTQDGAFDDLKIKEIFVPAWDSQLLPDLSVKTCLPISPIPQICIVLSVGFEQLQGDCSPGLLSVNPAFTSFAN